MKEITQPEPLLFMAAVCGSYFKISHPQKNEYLKEFWTWLTQNNGMDDELASVLVESLAPLVERTIELRGYKRDGLKANMYPKKGSRHRQDGHG